MSDFLMREIAPLSDEEWERLDLVVVSTARQFLVGRKFIELVGPLGAGMEVVPVGIGDDRRFLELSVIQHDFKLLWRDNEGNRRMGLPVELGSAAREAAACARDEDKLIFGSMLEAAGNEVELGSWDEPESAFGSVVEATQKLVSGDFYGPYAVVLSTPLYAQTQRLVPNMGRLESKLIEDVAKGGLFQSPVLEKGQGLVVSLGPWNFDLAVGQDLITAYMGNDELDHLYRVMESLVLRVKRPRAICKLT